MPYEIDFIGPGKETNDSMRCTICSFPWHRQKSGQKTTSSTM